MGQATVVCAGRVWLADSVVTERHSLSECHVQYAPSILFGLLRKIWLLMNRMAVARNCRSRAFRDFRIQALRCDAGCLLSDCNNPSQLLTGVRKPLENSTNIGILQAYDSSRTHHDSRRVEEWPKDHVESGEPCELGHTGGARL